MRDGFAVFDTHTHIGFALHSGRRYNCDQLLRDMDRNGVDRAVVLPFPVVEDQRQAHDEIGRAVLAHSDRLSGAAGVMPFVPENQFRVEVKRCREMYGLRALKFQPQYQPLNPLADSSGFVFETALENGMALICHTGSGVPFALPSLFMPAAKRFPELKIVLAHSGGGVLVNEAIVAAMFCPNVYLELSSLMPHHVLEVMRKVPSARLMIGSDLPVNQETEIGKILKLDVSDEDKRAMLSGTAASVFC